MGSLLQEWSAAYWVQGGCPKEKLLIGMPLYGHGFTLEDPAQNYPGAPSTRGGAGGSYYKVGNQNGKYLYGSQGT